MHLCGLPKSLYNWLASGPKLLLYDEVQVVTMRSADLGWDTDWLYMAVCGVQPCEDIYPHLTKLQAKDRLYHTRHSTVHLCLIFSSNITTSSRSRHHVRHLFKYHHIRWHNSDNKSPLYHRLIKYFTFNNLPSNKVCTSFINVSTLLHNQQQLVNSYHTR